MISLDIYLFFICFAVLNRILWVVPFIEFHGWPLLFLSYYLTKKNNHDEFFQLQYKLNRIG